MFKAFMFASCLFFINCSNSKTSDSNKIAEVTIEINQTPIINDNAIEQKSTDDSCPNGMIHIVGNYCPKVKEVCKTWNPNDPSSGPNAKFRRCLEFYPTECLSKEKIPMNFCIDKEEYTDNHKGSPSNLPVTNLSWTEYKEIGKSMDKRFCSEDEWIFAAAGEEMFPYTTGLKRPTGICNIDRDKDIICGKDLCDHRASSEEYPNCLSPFGVHNMAGNVDEFIEVKKYQHSKIKDLWMRSALKGGHWLPVRNRTTPRTNDHDEGFHQISIGTRFCKDVK